MNPPNNIPTHALLLVAPSCPHCSPVLDAMSRMIKDGVLGYLEVINIAIHPDKARNLGARSTPWIRIGRFEFTGYYNEEELRDWVKLSQTKSGFSLYFTHLIEIRRLDKIVKMIREHPDTLNDLLQLLEDLENPMSVRIGVGATLEELQEQGLLSMAIPKLIDLSTSDLPQIRADACHYLGLTASSEALPAVERLLTDDDSEVREIATETFALLNSM